MKLTTTLILHALREHAPSYVSDRVLLKASGAKCVGPHIDTLRKHGHIIAHTVTSFAGRSENNWKLEDY